MSWEVQQEFGYGCHTIHRCNIPWIKEFKNLTCLVGKLNQLKMLKVVVKGCNTVWIALSFTVLFLFASNRLIIRIVIR